MNKKRKCDKNAPQYSKPSRTNLQGKWSKSFSVYRGWMDTHTHTDRRYWIIYKIVIRGILLILQRCLSASRPPVSMETVLMESMSTYVFVNQDIQGNYVKKVSKQKLQSILSYKVYLFSPSFIFRISLIDT